MRDVTIARLIVGKRHSRVLTVGNINSDATGFGITSPRTHSWGLFNLKSQISNHSIGG
jgi:hypothetical protein